MVKSVQPSKWSRLRRLRIRFNESPASTKSAKKKSSNGKFFKIILTQIGGQLLREKEREGEERKWSETE